MAAAGLWSARRGVMSDYRLAIECVRISTILPSCLRTMTSRYTGVCFHGTKKTWQSKVTQEGKRLSLGLFATELEAAKQIDR
jgi:hypothetical protein